MPSASASGTCRSRLKKYSSLWKRPKENPKVGDELWRRREGVEPSGDLTIPRLVLKTSGTTGHLPSPQKPCSSLVVVLVWPKRGLTIVLSYEHEARSRTRPQTSLTQAFWREVA